MPEYDDTRIPAPRVSIIDPRTGLMSREWFRFFVNLYNLADTVGSDDEVEQLKLGPSSSTLETYQAVIEQQLQDLAIAPVPQQHTPQRRYGTFYDTTTQTAAATNTAYAVTFNTTDLSSGVTLGTPTSRIYVDRPGIYNFQFSLQLGSTTASNKNVFIWSDINGTSVADSATKITLKGSSEYFVAAWNFVYRLNAGDYFRLMWSTTDTNVQIQYDAASAPVPAIPSVIMTVTDNIGD
jgi:hypothetical protein